MKKIEAIFRQEKLEILKEKLLGSDCVQGITIYQVNGCGNQNGWVAIHRGSEVMMNTLPKVYLMTVVPDQKVDKVVKLIQETVYTGEVGDGKIFISTIDECIRIRTNEKNEKAL